MTAVTPTTRNLVPSSTKRFTVTVVVIQSREALVAVRREETDNQQHCAILQGSIESEVKIDC